MPWKPGQSGNPRGRPPKERTLSRLVERALAARMDVPGEDRRTARKRVMAQLLAQAVSEGKVTFPDGRVEEFGAMEWGGFVLRVLRHLEGSAPAQVDLHASEGGVTFVFRPHAGDDDDDDNG